MRPLLLVAAAVLFVPITVLADDFQVPDTTGLNMQPGNAQSAVPSAPAGPAAAPATNPAPKDRQVLTRMAQCLSQSPVRSMQPTPKAPAEMAQCYDATIVADDSDEFVLEDRKMTPSLTDSKSGCSKNGTPTAPIPSLTDYAYIHMDAIPFATVTGDEDPKAWGLQTIWSQAWKTGLGFKAVDADHLLLVANPKAKRSQDQLHIHVVAVTDENKAHLLDPSKDADPAKRVPPDYIDDLSEVWAAAKINADALGKKLGINGGLDSSNFGIAVTFDPAQGKYAVAAVTTSPEQDYATLCAPWTP